MQTNPNPQEKLEALKTQLEQSYADLEALEQDLPKFQALIAAHELSAKTATEDAEQATKRGDLHQASELLEAASQRENQAKTARGFLEKQKEAIQSVKESIKTLELQLETVSIKAELQTLAIEMEENQKAFLDDLEKLQSTLPVVFKSAQGSLVRWREQKEQFKKLHQSLGISRMPFGSSNIHALNLQNLLDELESHNIPAGALTSVCSLTQAWREENCEHEFKLPQTPEFLAFVKWFNITTEQANQAYYHQSEAARFAAREKQNPVDANQKNEPDFIALRVSIEPKKSSFEGFSFECLDAERKP